MEISALTRSVVKSSHAIISPDGYINSNVPGYTDCVVNVIINEQMGADFCQMLITAGKTTILSGETKESQIFFFMVKGSASAKIDSDVQTLKESQFVYIPINKKYYWDDFTEGTQIITFHKVYKKLHGHDTPATIFGGSRIVPANEFQGDPALRLQALLPDNPSFDMAVNIFTYDPGGHLPMVETHVMEHGLLFLKGQGVYMLAHEWYPVKQGDSIWMAPYCQQWFTAMGKEPAVYIYYKNINRFPTTI